MRVVYYPDFEVDYGVVHETTRDVYRVVREFMIENVGRAPSKREIGALVRPEQPLSSSVVHYHLDKLFSLGVIARHVTYESRGIALVGAVFLPPAMPVWMVSDG